MFLFETLVHEISFRNIRVRANRSRCQEQLTPTLNSIINPAAAKWETEKSKWFVRVPRNVFGHHLRFQNQSQRKYLTAKFIYHVNLWEF